MKAVILAGGFATRLYPLTLGQPKALLEVAGRPVLAHILERLPPVEEVVVVTNARFHDRFLAWDVRRVCNGARREEERPGAVADLVRGWKAAGGGDVLVAAGDNLLRFDLAGPAARFGREGRPLILVRPLPEGVDQTRTNEVEVDPQGGVTSFVEKPVTPRSRLSALCVYFFPGAVLGLAERYLEAGGNPDAPGHLLEWLTGQTPVMAEPVEGDVLDVGCPEGLERARRLLGKDAITCRSGSRRP